MKLKFKKLFKIISSVLVSLVVLLVLLLFGVQLFGLKVYHVLSPSMEPDYPTGSLIYVMDVDPATLNINDVITFKVTGDTIATHRIIELIPDEGNPDIVRFRTKGDANKVADGSLVNYESVIGKPVFCIPLLGYLSAYIAKPPGKYISISIAFILIISDTMIEIITNDKDNKNNKTKQKNKKEILL